MPDLAVSHRPRIGRVSESNRIYLITTNTHGRVPIFDDFHLGFHDRALRNEDDLVKMARYVVANPLRAGLVERIGDYPLWDAIWV